MSKVQAFKAEAALVRQANASYRGPSFSKDSYTGYLSVYINGHEFVGIGDCVWKKGEALKLAKQREAKGKWYVVEFHRTPNYYNKSEAVTPGYKSGAQAEKVAEKMGDKYVVRWLED